MLGTIQITVCKIHEEVVRAFQLLVGPNKLQGYLQRSWPTPRPPVRKELLLVLSYFNFSTSKETSTSSHRACLFQNLDPPPQPQMKMGRHRERMCLNIRMITYPHTRPGQGAEQPSQASGSPQNLWGHPGQEEECRF